MSLPRDGGRRTGSRTEQNGEERSRTGDGCPYPGTGDGGRGAERSRTEKNGAERGTWVPTPGRGTGDGEQNGAERSRTEQNGAERGTDVPSPGMSLPRDGGRGTGSRTEQNGGLMSLVQGC